jgi:DNA-binding Xre family transcriptional regulator
MKSEVLVATRDVQAHDRLQTAVADLCRLKRADSPGHAYKQLREKSFDAFILDSKLPELDSMELAHTMWHGSYRNPVFISWGPLDLDIVLCARSIVHPMKESEPMVIRRSLPLLIKALRALLDPTAERTLEAVRYQPKEDVFFVAFRNGKSYELSRRLIEADDGSPLVGEPRVIDGGNAFEVRLQTGKTYQVAWDFVLYHQESSYPYHKGQTGQREAEVRSAERIATRIRHEREARKWSLGELARRTGMQAPNLSRLESGKHMPSLETLERVALALGMRVADLVAA